jgi:hypothetical protein
LECIKLVSTVKAWPKSYVPIFLERFVLPALTTILIGVLVLNPFRLDLNQQISGAIAVVALAYFVGYSLHTSRRDKDNPVSEAKPATLFLQASYDPIVGTLPIELPSNARFDVLTLTDNMNANITWTPNTGSGRKAWPLGRVPLEPKQPVGLFRITNRSTSKLFNIACELGLEVRAGADIETEEKMATMMNSPVLATRSLPINIESLAPEGAFVVHVVNQSGYSLVLRFPSVGQAEISGNPEPQRVQIARRTGGMHDRIPPVSRWSPFVWQGDSISGIRSPRTTN